MTSGSIRQWSNGAVCIEQGPRSSRWPKTCSRVQKFFRGMVHVLAEGLMDSETKAPALDMCVLRLVGLVAKLKRRGCHCSSPIFLTYVRLSRPRTNACYTACSLNLPCLAYHDERLVEIPSSCSLSFGRQQSSRKVCNFANPPQDRNLPAAHHNSIRTQLGLWMQV